MNFSIYSCIYGREAYLLLVDIGKDKGWFFEDASAVDHFRKEHMWSEAELSTLQDLKDPDNKYSYIQSTETLEEAISLLKPMMLLKGIT